jgi:hypothetical protein
MSVIRVGSSSRYAEGWDAIFGGGPKRTTAAAGKKKATAATKPKATGGRKPSATPAPAKARRRT